MATDEKKTRKKIYIAKDGEILYDEQREEYLRNAPDEESSDSSEMYIKDGNVLCGREAVQERLADDVRDALKKSGINKWLDKLEKETKEAHKEEKIEDSKQDDDKNAKKSAIGKGLQVAKDVWTTGQNAFKTVTEAGKVIKDSLTGNAEPPEIRFSGNADFTTAIEGHVTPLQKTSNTTTVGEAQLNLKGRFHSNVQLNSKINDKEMNSCGTFDAKLSANARLAGLEIQTGDDTQQETTEQSAVEANTEKVKPHKLMARFEGQASASATGARIKSNASRSDQQHTPASEVPDIEMNATASAHATGVNVDIKTTDKTKVNNSTEKKCDPKLRMQGKASASATGVDIKIGNKLTTGNGEKSNAKSLEAHAHAEATGCEVQIGNKIETPKFKGASASAKVKASGATARVGNVYKSERNTSVAATAEARVAGGELNVGNVNLDKGSSTGVAAIKEVKPGLTAFNFQAGVGGQTGIRASTDVQFGNVTFNLGPPSINISPFAFNLGFGGGIKCSTGTAGKEDKGSASTGGGSSGNDGSGNENSTGSACGYSSCDASATTNYTAATEHASYGSGSNLTSIGNVSTINGGDSDQHGNFDYMGTDHTTNISAGFSNSYSSGDEYTGNAMASSTSNDSADNCKATGHHKNRKSNSANTTVANPLTTAPDDQANVVSEGPLQYNPHLFPRKLKEDSKSQSNVRVPSHEPSLGHQPSSSHGGKYSDTNSGGSMHPKTKNDIDTQREKKSDMHMLNDELSHRLSLALSRSKSSSKKNEKPSTSASRQETKQKLIEDLTKVREELETDSGNKSTTDLDVSSTGENEESKKTTSTQSSSKSKATKQKADTNDQQDIDDVEEVPISDEKKKPFGCHNNIFTMDSIRSSTYKVQTSNKSLQKIGSNVVGFK